jgi:orotidine-5'-phosphate decarboxylase
MESNHPSRHPDFVQRLTTAVHRAGGPLCVGIDPDLQRIPRFLRNSHDPIGATENFCRSIIQSTSIYAAAFKFNFAFFEAMGWQGVRLLEELVASVPPEVLTIADAKRGDIGNTARMYASAVYERMKFDSCTLSPYMGRDSIEPFLEEPGTCAFVLARTSNPGGSDFQSLKCDEDLLYRRVAAAARSWGEGKAASVGLVVGATDVQALKDLRQLCPDVPFLIPGVGAQGGTVADVYAAAGSGPLLINMSRSILYAGDGENFAEAARDAARLAVSEFGR